MECTLFAPPSGSMVSPYQYVRVEGGMRKRSRRNPNTSESTGKIGQELPSNQQRPLVPLYPDEVPAAVQQSGAQRSQEPVRRPAVQPQAEPRQTRPERPPKPESPAKQERPARQQWNEQAGSGRFELETQPEMPSVAPPEPEAAERSPQAPKGYVVLAIGLPGSGKTTWFHGHRTKDRGPLTNVAHKQTLSK